MVNIDMTYDNSLKLSFSIMMTVALISVTVITFQSRNIRVNKISILPYYAVIGLAFFMCVYYTVFALFSIEELTPEKYCVYKVVMGSPLHFFQCSIIFIMMVYTDLLRELLAY